MLGFLRFFGSGDKGLRPLEARLLEAVARALPPSAAESVRRQTEAVNLVQRHDQAREVNLYRMKGRKPFNDPALQLPDRSRERKLARIYLRVPGGDPERRKVEVVLVDGFVFSLLFDVSSQGILGRDDVEIEEVRLLIDPTVARQPITPRPMQREGALSGWLADWDARYGLELVLAPLSAADRQTREAEIGLPLPADYRDIVRQTDGFVAGGRCEVLGLSGCYEISRDGRPFLVLAQLGDEGVLSAAAAGTESGVWWHRFEEDVPPVPIASLRSGIESYLGNGTVAAEAG